MNPALTSLVNDVYALTNRPDLVSETLLAVRNATLKAHNTDYYYKDILETGISFDYARAQHALEYRQLIPRWRALKYLRKYIPNTSGVGGCPGSMLEVITPDQIFDSYNTTRENVCYVAGAQLQIRTREQQQYFLLGCYISPDVTEDKYCSWIAEEQPAAIVYAAASIIFKTIGFDEQAAAYQNLIADEYSQLKISQITSVGY